MEQKLTLTDGSATARLIKESTYNINLNTTEQSYTKDLLSGYLYLKENPNSWLNRSQIVTTGSADETQQLNWLKYPNYSDVSYWHRYQNIIAQNRANGHRTNYDTISLVASSNNITVQLPILKPNGNVIIFANSTASNSINTHEIELDINTGTVTTLEASTYKLFYTVSRMADGNIICFGSHDNTIYMFNVDSNTFTNSNSWVRPARMDTISIKLLPDGRILTAPNGGNSAHYFFGICDTLAKTYEYFGDQTGSYATAGLTLLPNGKLLAVPNRSGEYNTLIDPIVKTTTKFGPQASQVYAAACLLPDNKILSIPTAGYVPLQIVDPETLSVESVASGLTSSTIYYQDALLIPDGRVIYVEYSQWPRIFDPETKLNKRIIPTNLTTENYGKYVSNMILLPDGRILLCGGLSSQIYILSASDGNYGVLPEIDILLSSWVNHCR